LTASEDFESMFFVHLKAISMRRCDMSSQHFPSDAPVDLKLARSGVVLSPDAMSVFRTSYLTLYQVCWWVRYRTLDSCDVTHVGVLHDNEIKEVQDVIAGEAVADSKSKLVDAVLQLLAALEQGRVKATGRQNRIGNPTGNPKSFPAHYWPYLTFTNRATLTTIETCVCFKNAAPQGRCWSDLRFGAKGVLAVWPTPNDRKQLGRGAEDDAIDERTQHRRVASSEAVREKKT
jgi:hypothetical protein